jgi:capsular polysaccharide export protein
MKQAADYVLASFAANAPADVQLVIKEHPLDYASWGTWRHYVADRARALGLGDRLIHIAGGDLQSLALGSRGMVMVNSTSATFALAGCAGQGAGHRGLCHTGHHRPWPALGFLDEPHAPDPQLYDAFCRVLHKRCLVRGGLASRSATRILVENSLARLLEIAGVRAPCPYSPARFPPPQSG